MKQLQVDVFPLSYFQVSKLNYFRNIFYLVSIRKWWCGSLSLALFVLWLPSRRSCSLHFSLCLSVLLSQSKEAGKQGAFLFLESNQPVQRPTPFSTKRYTHIDAHKASLDRIHSTQDIGCSTFMQATMLAEACSPVHAHTHTHTEKVN